MDTGQYVLTDSGEVFSRKLDWLRQATWYIHNVLTGIKDWLPQGESDKKVEGDKTGRNETKNTAVFRQFRKGTLSNGRTLN
jgi:hypothetical protein